MPRRVNFPRNQVAFCALFIAAFFVIQPTPSSYADWEAMPESHAQLYDAWGLFVDNQTTLLNYGQARIWGALGGTMPVYGNAESIHHPEIVFQASVNAGLHYNDNWRIWTETIDLRIGLAYQWELNPNLRFSAGLVHISAHSADGISTVDSALIEPSVGQEYIPIRAVYDLDKMFRFVVTLKPFIRSSPSVQRLWADQSVEYFPFGARDDRQHFSPYIAVGLDESGTTSYVLTYHGQIGAYLGNHFGSGHHPSFRAVLGYSSGYDPRLKYFELANARMDFGYLGLMFDI